MSIPRCGAAATWVWFPQIRPCQFAQCTGILGRAPCDGLGLDRRPEIRTGNSGREDLVTGDTMHQSTSALALAACGALLLAGCSSNSGGGFFNSLTTQSIATSPTGTPV